VTFSDLKTDCRHMRWDRPCAPHKRRGKVCSSCDEYDPIQVRVLMVKLAANGDVLRTTSFLPAIHATWPHAKVTWLTRRSAADLFVGNPLVDEVLTAEDPITSARLATETFDVVLCPDADPEAAVLAAMAHARQRRGYVRDAAGQVVPLGPGAAAWLRMGLSDTAKQANRETYQKLVAEVLGFDPALVREPILVPGAADAAFAEAFVSGLPGQGPIVGLNTGAGGRWAYKQWTRAHQETFLRLCTDAGARVLLLGGPEEVQRHADLLAAAAGRPSPCTSPLRARCRPWSCSAPRRRPRSSCTAAAPRSCPKASNACAATCRAVTAFHTARRSSSRPPCLRRCSIGSLRPLRTARFCV
jgi:ADP-heptose:LPS heptosyltransferase